MPTTDHDRRLEALDDQQCRLLLATAPIGRLGFTRDALPEIQPVSFRVDGQDVVIPVRPDGRLRPGTRGAVVVFEADSYDHAARTGWSVSVVGPSRWVADPAGVAAYDLLAWSSPALAPDRCYVTVQMTLVRGWRTVPVAAPVASRPADRRTAAR